MVKGLIPVALQTPVASTRTIVRKQPVHRHLCPFRETGRQACEIPGSARNSLIECDDRPRPRFGVMEERELVGLQFEQFGSPGDKRSSQSTAKGFGLIVGNQALRYWQRQRVSGKLVSQNIRPRMTGTSLRVVFSPSFAFFGGQMSGPVFPTTRAEIKHLSHAINPCLLSPVADENSALLSIFEI